MCSHFCSDWFCSYSVVISCVVATVVPGAGTVGAPH